MPPLEQLLDLCFDVLNKPQEPVPTDCYEIDPETGKWRINRKLLKEKKPREIEQTPVNLQ
jgi:hypothetical protein